MTDNQYPKVVANPKLGCPVYELVVYDHLKALNPPPGFELEKIDPVDYFVTSGDAIQKTKYLSGVIWRYAGKARKQLNLMRPKSKDAVVFEKLCWEQAGAVNRLLHLLEKVRGSAVFLETEWNIGGTSHTLLLVPKNPRVKKNKNKEEVIEL